MVNYFIPMHYAVMKSYQSYPGRVMSLYGPTLHATSIVAWSRLVPLISNK